MCLIDTTPHLHTALPSLKLEAVTAINQGIAQIKGSGGHWITADLVLAIFALGTLERWENKKTSTSEQSWLEVARELLCLWKSSLSALDALFHSHFCQALTYWEMLETIARRGDAPTNLARRRPFCCRQYLQPHEQTSQENDAPVHGPMPYESGQSLLGTRPNSWCGVSNEVIDLFGQALALCRSSRQQNQSTGRDAATDTSYDIALAKEVQGELLALDFKKLITLEEERGFPVQTRDGNTPVSHLLQTAEAYRLASLLQLHLAFGSLPLEPWRRKDNADVIAVDDAKSYVIESTGDSASDCGRRTLFLHKLAMQLVATLNRIPADSGSSSIHPMLYLSAGAGLRFENLVNTLGVSSVQSSSETGNSSSRTFPRLNDDICRARSLVLTRLATLQGKMPRKAGKNLLKLIEAIWLGYDNQQVATPQVHWLNIMSRHRKDVDQ